MSDAEIVALIEVGDSHDECLHAQIEYLRRHGHRVHLVLSQSVQRRAGGFAGVDRVAVVPEAQGMWKSWRQAIWLKRYLREQGIRTAVLNTAHGRVVRNFCWIAGRELRLLGILHGARKLLRRSFTQRAISRRVETYFVLNDYIRDHVLAAMPDAPVETLYPVYLPGCESISDRPAATERPLTICIPGPVHSSRRDYEGLLEMLARGPLPGEVRFVLLGKCGEQKHRGLSQQLAQAKLTDRFTLFSEFVPQDEFQRQMAACDMVMPLIHPRTPNFSLYRTLQITGSFNLAFAYRKPLLMHRAFDDVEDFRRTAYFYDAVDLVDVVQRLATDRGALDCQRQELQQWEKLQISYQAQQYIAAIQQRRPLRAAA